jgi:hypothetical protein
MGVPSLMVISLRYWELLQEAGGRKKSVMGMDCRGSIFLVTVIKLV